MRISDWSSDVCSSDLRRPRTAAGRPFLPPSRASSARAAAPPRPSPIAAFRGPTASCECSCPEPGGKQIGTASWPEGVCQNVWIQVGAGSITKHKQESLAKDRQHKQHTKQNNNL